MLLILLLIPGDSRSGHMQLPLILVLGVVKNNQKKIGNDQAADTLTQDLSAECLVKLNVCLTAE